MKKLFTSILLLTLLFTREKASALPSGTYVIPSPTFGSLAEIITDLNTNGIVGLSGVTINVTAGYNETAPSGGFVLGSTVLNTSITSFAKFITINGSGCTLTANSGTGSTDAIFTVQGTDYVTLNNFKFLEASTNTTATSMMERGVAVVKLNMDDAVITFGVKNSEIVLNKSNTSAPGGTAQNGAMGVYVANSTATSTAMLGQTFTIEGAHDGIIISGNTIKNVNSGVVAMGNLLVADGSTYNDKGLTIENNIIENFTNYGIWIAFFNNDLVRSNTLNNMSSGGSAPTNSHLYGISYWGNVYTATGNSWTCEKNNINLTTAVNGTYEVYGVFTGINGPGTTTIAEDTIVLTSTGTSAGMIGIYSQNDKGTQNINKNYIHGFRNTAGSNQTQRVAAIYNGYSATWTLSYPSLYNYPEKSTIDGNLIQDFAISNGATDNIGILHVVSDVNLTTYPTVFTNNTIDNITLTGNPSRFFGYGSTYLYSAMMTQTANISNNVFSNISTAASSAPTYVLWPRAAYSGRNSTIKGNNFKNITGGTGLLIAIALDYGTNTDVSNDTITNVTGAGDVHGIYGGSSVYALNTMFLSKNLISSISTTGAGKLAAGIRIAPGSSNITTATELGVNLISNISASDASGTAHGIYYNGGSYTTNAYNNIISAVSASANTAAYSSSFGINIQSSGSNTIVYNTINLSPTASSGYGATGVMFNSAAGNIIQNNIIRVNVTAGASNNVSAVRNMAGAAGSAPSTTGFNAKNNIYYTPTGANNYLYVEGTTNSGLVNGYNVSGLTDNTTKNIVNDMLFNSDCDKSSYHNFMKSALGREKQTYTEDNLVLTGGAGMYAPAASALSFAEAAAIDLTAVSFDFIGTPRVFESSDIGALEFNGLTRPNMEITIVSSTGLDEACVYNLPKLNATIPAYFTKVKYQWYRDGVLIPGATTNSVSVSPVSGNYTLSVYDELTGCTYMSSPFRMTIQPPPPAIITYYDSLTFCESSAVVLQANKGKDYIYRWLHNGSIIPGESNDHLTVDKAGDYNVEVNTPLGCPTTSTSIHITVYPLPTPTVFYNGPRLLKTQRYFLYQWYKNNVLIPGSDAQNQVYFALTDGAYTVEVTDSNGCSAKSDIYLYSLGVKDNNIAASIKVYPNPATDKITIESPVAVSVRVNDLTGRLILEKQNAKVLDVAHLAEGVYIINISDTDGNLISVQKISKTN